MRTKTGLRDFDGLAILCKYLYFSSNNTVIYNNGFTDLELSMRDDYSIWCRPLKFPNMKLMSWNHEFYNSFDDIIKSLKIKPPVGGLGFEANNRWEEICTVVTLANRYYAKKGLEQ